MLKLVCLSVLLSFVCLVQAETPTTQSNFNSKTCNKIEQELKNLQSIMLNQKSGGTEPLRFAQSAHDRAMAELIVLKGIKELKERHNKFLRDVTNPNNSDINGDLAKLNQFRGDVKDGIDVMGRMMVFQNMIDEIIDLEMDWDNPGQKNQFQNKVRKDPKELKKLLTSRCAEMKGGARAKVDQFPLCAVLSPPNGKDYEGLERVEKKRLKGKIEALEGFSPNLDKMIEGFAKAYIVKHDQAVDDKQAAQKRLEALHEYKSLLTQDFPEPLQPKNLYDQTLRLHQNLLATAGKAQDESDQSQKSKNILEKRVETLNEIKKISDLRLSINEGLEKYKDCLGKLRMKTLVGQEITDPINYQVVNNREAIEDLENLDEKPPLVLDPEAEAPGYRCELSLPQFQCPTIKDKKDAGCKKIQDKFISMESAQEEINNFQKNLSQNLGENLNKYVSKISQMNSDDDQTEGGEKINVLRPDQEEGDGANFKFKDMKSKSDSLSLSGRSGKDKKLNIENEKVIKSAKEDQKFFQNQFKGYLSSLNLFNDRAKMMANVFDQDDKDATMDAKKTFLKALQSAGCLGSHFNLNIDIGLENAAKEVFTSSEDSFKANVSDSKGIKSYDHKNAQVTLKPSALNKCLNSNKLDDKIEELKTEVLSKKGQIQKIKSSDDYLDLNELKVQQFKRYSLLCKKPDNSGFRTFGRCRVKYDQKQGTESLETFISHNGKILGVMALSELKSLPSYIEDKRKATKRMSDACDEHKDVLPEMCVDAKNKHHNAMLKTNNEKIREAHEKYHITYAPDGTQEIRRKKSVVSMAGEELARGIVQYGVPTWAQYEMNKSQMEYNEAMGYNLKIQNYLLEHPGTFVPGFGGYGYSMYGYGGFYPYSTFGSTFYTSPFLSGPVMNGSYQYNYLSAQ